MGGGGPEDKSLEIIRNARRGNKKWLIFFAVSTLWCLANYAVTRFTLMLASGLVNLGGIFMVLASIKLWQRTERRVLFMRDSTDITANRDSRMTVADFTPKKYQKQ